MKKIILILMAAAMILSMVGCGTPSTSGDSAPATQDDTVEAAEPEPEQEEEPEDEPEPVAAEGEGELGKYYVSIKGAEMGSDYQDKDCIIVTYEWTNNNDDAKSFILSLNATAYQNGIECERAMMVDGVDAQDLMKDIKSGATMEFQVAYVLADLETEVEIEIVEAISFASDKPMVSKVFELPL